MDCDAKRFPEIETRREVSPAEARRRLREIAGRTRVRSLVERYPLTSIAVAVGAGLLLSSSAVARKAAAGAAMHFLFRR